MSYNAQLVAWKIPGPTGSDRLVLMALAERADEDGKCFPSQATIAADLGLSERTVWASLKVLEAMRVISRRPLPKEGAGRSVDEYTLLFELRLARRDEPTAPQNTTKPLRKNCGHAPAKTAEEPISGLTTETSREVSYNAPSKAFSDEGEFLDFDLPVEPKAAEPAKPERPAKAPKLPKAVVLADPHVGSAKGYRLPEGWTPGDKGWNYAKGRGFRDRGVQDMFEAFTDWWRAVPGQKGVKLDWDATWRTWVRNQKGTANGSGNYPGGGGRMGWASHSGGGGSGFGTMADAIAQSRREEAERDEIP